MPPRHPTKPAARTEYLAFGRPDFGEEEIAAVTRVLRSGWVGMGPEVIAFEGELEAATGASHVVTVSSCTAALHLALLAHGVGPGHEVIVPSLTWCSTANAALYVGATPVFCEVDPQTMGITPQTVRAALTPRTKAVMAVHFGGLAVDVEALRSSLSPQVAIVEDAAHALGARYPSGQPVGASGNIVCFSFYANKNLSTAEGGALALADPHLADRLRSLRQHGLPNDAWRRFVDPRHIGPGHLAELGFKMNYTDLQAALGRVQLRRQAELAARRRAVARHYLARLPVAAPGATWQGGLDTDAHARHLFVVRTPAGAGPAARDALLLRLRQENIGASIHYSPLHRMALYGSSPALPVTDALAAQILTLPISASMSDADAEDVMQAVAYAWTETFPSPVANRSG